MDIANVARPFGLAAKSLQSLLFASAYDVLGPVLLERFIATKAHPIRPGMPTSETHIVARAADIAMMLEYLFNEGGTSEVGFRLGMSVAWLLGAAPAEREHIIETLKKVYGLRNKRVHGAEIRSKDVQAAMMDSVACADRLLRRAIVARLLAGSDDTAWKCVFSPARVGALPDGFDQACWVP